MATWPGQFFFMAEIPDHEMIDLCETALATLGTEDPIRVRVLTTLAVHLTFASAPERRLALIDEAIEASQGVAPTLRFSGRHSTRNTSVCGSPPPCRAASTSGRHLSRSPRAPAMLNWSSSASSSPHTSRPTGTASGGPRPVGWVSDLVRRTHHPYFEFLAERLILSIDLARGEPGAAARIDALAERHGPTHADTEGRWALPVRFPDLSGRDPRHDDRYGRDAGRGVSHLASRAGARSLHERRPAHGETNIDRTG